MTRLVVADPDMCQGHAMCALEAPDLFQVPKRGTVEVLAPEVTPANEAAVRAAIRHCPTQALSIEES
jgi:ferredoxin